MIEFRSIGPSRIITYPVRIMSNVDGFGTNGFTIGIVDPRDGPLPVISTLLGRIADGEADSRGDRACSHVNMHGSFILGNDALDFRTYAWRDSASNSVDTIAPGVFVNGQLLFVGAVLTPGQNYEYRGPAVYGSAFESRNYKISVSWISDVEFKVVRTHEMRKPPGVGPWKVDVVTAKVQLDWNLFKYRMTMTDVYPTRWSTFPSKRVISSVPPQPPTFLDSVYRRIKEALPYPDVNWDWGDLCQEAANDARMLDINTGMYLYELSQLGQSIKSTAELVRGKASLKSLASLYLSFHYGYRLSYKDTMTIVKKARSEFRTLQKDYRFVRSRASGLAVLPLGPLKGRQVTVIDHYKIYYRSRPELWFRGLERLFNLDLFPTLENTWDLVPFSFVIDWFRDVSSLLEDIDTRTQLALLSVLGTLKSTKLIVEGLGGPEAKTLLGLPIPLSGSWSVSYYERTMDDHVILPRIRTETSPKFDNWVEATALIVQKRR